VLEQRCQSVHVYRCLCACVYIFWHPSIYIYIYIYIYIGVKDEISFTSSSSSSSSLSYICHSVWPLADPFLSQVSRSLFKGLPRFLLPVGQYCFITLGNLFRRILFTCCIQLLLYSNNLSKIVVIFNYFTICAIMSRLHHHYHHHNHHHHKHQALDPLIRSVSTVTAARANASSIFQLFSFLVICSGMI